MRRWVGSAAVLLAVAGVLYFATLSQAGFECEACMEFQGRQSCRTVAGPSEADARRGAISNACATLTSGVTETLRCEGAPPVRLECRPR